ncbi:MAG: hypothetical protein AAEJ04_02410 [Planctomycetota bacterium]
MPFNEKIQYSIVNLVEAFEELQGHLEVKHFGQALDENTDFENLPETAKENLDSDFHDVMVNVIEGLDSQKKLDIRDVEAVSGILLDAIDEVFPLEEVSDEEVSDEEVSDEEIAAEEI